MIPYLSPTSFIRFRKQCEYRVYLEKVKQVLSKEEYSDQGMPQATGIAFDIIMKGALNRRIKVEEELKKEILPCNTAVIQLAREMFEAYSRGPLQALKAEGIGFGSVDQEVELVWEEPFQTKPIQVTDKTFIPASSTLGSKTWKSILYGKPDLTLKTGEVLDIKTSGMWGRGTRPKRGYIRCFVFSENHPMSGKDLGPSPEGEDNVPMETINEDWAIQLYLYNRLLGHNPGEKLRAGIEHICVEYAPSPTIWIASFRNPISPSFQLEIERAYHDAFDRLNESLPEDSKRIESPQATKYRCISYGKLCACAPYCSSYKTVTADGRVKL